MRCENYFFFLKDIKASLLSFERIDTTLKFVSFFVFGDKPTYKRVPKRILESVVWNYKF